MYEYGYLVLKYEGSIVRFIAFNTFVTSMSNELYNEEVCIISAQGPDGGISASKYCYLGGFDATRYRFSIE